jgi:molybdopterin/thiamine biosynthesis adenylyltransferase/rhodanese-related sulfurtransferase
MEGNNSYERYQRQSILKGFGTAGQQRLLDSKLLVIGAGGLGCPALQYLAGAGLGHIGVADDDVVSISNLHRQPLYSTADVGSSKALTAKRVLEALNPGIMITAHCERISQANALEIIGRYDLVIDGSDNLPTRYLVNDACLLLGKPLIYGAISTYEGQVAIFNCSNGQGGPPVNYRDLFPHPPAAGEVLNCAEAGVLGVLPGIIGLLQAAEAIKLITGIGKPLINSLLTYNLLNNECYEISLSAVDGSGAMGPQTAEAFKQVNYDWLCSAMNKFEIDVRAFIELVNKPGVDIIDVREEGEMPTAGGIVTRAIPISRLAGQLDSIGMDTVVFFCQSGSRSRQAAEMLADRRGDSKTIYSLAGGILAWLNEHPKQQA